MDSAFLTGDLTLEEKLKLIDEKMEKLQKEENTKAKQQGRMPNIIDPADATMCEGCQ